MAGSFDPTTAVQNISFFVALFATLITIPWLIRKAREVKIVGKDMNKPDKREIPEMGGIGVVIGFTAGIAVLLVSAKYLGAGDEKAYSFIAVSLIAVMGAAITGFMDDLFNMRQRVKAVLPFIFAIPLGVWAVDLDTTIRIGFLHLDFASGLGSVFLMLLLALGVTCAANAANMLEGFNGLGSGLALIITVTLIIISLGRNITMSLYILFPLFGALVAFLYFNLYPARIFPGDTFTLFAGAAIASASIIGNIKTIGALLFLPMILEFFLKARGSFRGENYGKVDENGNLYYDARIESLTHIPMRWKRMKEYHLVFIFWILEIVWCAIVAALVFLDVLTIR